jgi:endonuclease G
MRRLGRPELGDGHAEIREAFGQDTDVGSREAIIIADAVLRPSLVVKQDTFEPPIAAHWKARLLPHQARVEVALRSVGRVEIDNHERLPWVGTAWVVAPGIVATNRHVAEEFVGPGLALGRNVFGDPYEVHVNFRAEHLQPDRRRVRVIEALYVAPEDEPDVAFLRLEERPDLPAPLILSASNPTARTSIGVIGYPAYDDRNDIAAMSRVFEDIYGVKRLALGEVMLEATSRPDFTHDASTLGGCSGSVVIDLETAEAVGLHFAGEFESANSAVGVETIRNLLPRVMDGAGQPAVPRIEVPLVSPSFQGADEAVPTDLDERGGYDPAFLGVGVDVPLPDLGASRESAATRLDDPAEVELKYTHFSIVMHARRRFALVTASNLDGEEARQIVRKKSEKWYYDPRIAKEHQAGNELYARNSLDRGHLVRRLDPAWGTKGIALAAEQDTFFWTNCTPQHATYNQRTWVELEDYILSSAITHGLRACVFTGPVLKTTDPHYRGLQLPRSFWKVVVMRSAATTGALHATAYVLSQANLLTDLEFAYGAFKTYQVSIAKVSRLTGLGFASLQIADPLGRSESAPIRELVSLSDIKL